MAALRRALDEYTGHKARLITFKQTYLDYETDVFDPPLNTVQELCDWADFFVLGEVLARNFITDEIYKQLSPDNTIIRAGGTLARQMPQLYMTGGLAPFIKTGAYHDITICRHVSPMAQTVNMYFFSEWPRREPDDGVDRPVKIVFSGTAQKHSPVHTAGMPEALAMLKNKYGDRIELVNITNTSWKECLKIKSGCDICFDQFHIGTYASSAVEGMYYGMPTFCYMNRWADMVHPDAPLISAVSADQIFSGAVRYIEDLSLRRMMGKEGHEYVLRVHDAGRAIERWTNLIEFVSTEYRPLS